MAKALSILYVDDEAANRIVFQHSFKGRLPILTASSGVQALAIIRSQPIAVVVTDQRMPEMSGNELLTRLKESHPDIIRIVVTAYNDPKEILANLNSGLAARYLVKPWNRVELEETLTWALTAYEERVHASAVQLRLLQATRQATIGFLRTIADDLRSPASYLSHAAREFAQLAAEAPAIDRLIARFGDALAPEDVASLEAIRGALPFMAPALGKTAGVITEISERASQIVATNSAQEPARTTHEIMQELLVIGRALAADANATLTYDGPQDLPPLHISGPELGQVVLNLVLNSAQAITRKGEFGGRILVSAKDLGDNVEISVRDNGPGIATEVVERMCKPLERRGDHELGLAQCQRVLGRYGGILRIGAVEGGGTVAAVVINKLHAHEHVS